MNENVYIVGFMGAGKSTVGRLLAELFGRRFVDMDRELEREFGRSIPEVFAHQGEAVFRKAEYRLLERLGGQSRLIVATGGGLPETRAARQVINRTGRAIWLDVPFDACRQRVEGAGAAGRPMWSDPAGVAALYEHRHPLYAKTGQRLKTDQLPPEAVARQAAFMLDPDRRFEASLGGRRHPVVATREVPGALAAYTAGRKTALITDRRVARLHLDRYREAIQGDVLDIVLQGGERIKTLRTVERVYNTLLEARFDRDDLIVAVGGGTVTDLGAFIAATYKRGAEFVLCSTTLLGCVDAAVGGKAAVNLKAAKNIVGAFTIPRAVFLDLHSLGTLDKACISDGLIEAYKTGLVANPELAGLIEAEADALCQKDMPGLSEVAARSAHTKAGVVAEDFRESGRRAILNLGHTYGHAVEGWHRYKIGHGLAVAVGLKAAARVSQARGLLPDADADRIVRTVDRVHPVRVPLPPVEEAWEIMRHDKKIRAGKMVFVLLEGAGCPVLVNDVTKAEVAAAASMVAAEKSGEN